MAGLTVEVVHSASVVEAHCPVCGTSFALTFPAAVLHQDSRPLGYLCEGCLLAGPRQAAARVREWAAELRASVGRTGALFTVAAWGGMFQSLRRRAEHWEELAGRLEGLATWPRRV